jgi:cytochrome P450
MPLGDKLFNPLAPDELQDPYPTYRRLRESHPVYWHKQLNCWILTRYLECSLILGDSDLFGTDPRRAGLATHAPLVNLQTLDPPENAPLRDFAMAALRSQDLAAFEEDAKRRAEDLWDGLEGRQTIDFVNDFADPFALGSISYLLGIEAPPIGDSWNRMNDDLDRSMDSGLAPGALLPGLKARSAFSALVKRWLLSEPKKGMLGYIAANRDAIQTSQEVLVHSLRVFWHAGFETPSRFLGNALLALLRCPRGLRELHNVGSLERAVEELVRYAGPVHALSRIVMRETRLADHTIKRGETVVALIAAGNRDPEQFPDAERMILDRDPNSHFGFGRGAHACLGAQIAKMEARAALSSALRRYPDMGLAGEPRPRPNATQRGLARLPVRLRAAGFGWCAEESDGTAKRGRGNGDRRMVPSRRKASGQPLTKSQWRFGAESLRMNILIGCSRDLSCRGIRRRKLRKMGGG